MQNNDTRKRKDIDKNKNDTNNLKYIEKTSIHTDDIVEKTNKMLNEIHIKKKIGLILGQGDVGQLGLGDDVVERRKPAIINGLGDLLQIVCGGMHTVALTVNNQIYSWGCNDDYALGRDTNDTSHPENIPNIVDIPNKYVPIKITAGDSHTAVLTECGSVLICGIYRDSDRKIGLIYKDLHQKYLSVIYEKTNEKGSHAVKIASGNDHLLILTANGRIYSCGSPQQGQLGRVTSSTIDDNGGRRGMNIFFEPTRIPFVCYTRDSRRIKQIRSPFVDIICGSYHSFAIDKDGHVYGWGLNNYGQLGFNNIKDSKLLKPPTELDDNNNLTIDPESIIIYRPVMIGPITYFSSKNNTPKIAAGQHHTIFIDTSTKYVYGIGRSDYGRLGIGPVSKPFYTAPQKTDIKNINNENDSCMSVACGEVTSYIVGARRNLYSFGMGNNLQLSLGDDSDSYIPTKATGKNLTESGGVVDVSSGGQHTAILVLK